MDAMVSVIIPAYNAARYLPDALDSVFAQTHRELEVIVIDDGSTDDTAAILQGYDDPRLTVIRQANSGIGAARNVGLKVARGEFVAFLDADDIWLPDKLAIQLEAMQDAGVMLCGSAGQASETHRTPRRILTYRDLLANNPFSASSVMVRQTCLANVGCFEERRELHGVEDWDMWLRIAARYRILFLNRRLADIRAVEGSVSCLQHTRAMLAAELDVLAKQARGLSGIRPGVFQLRKAYAYRYFCAAWGEWMQGNRREAWACMRAVWRYYPPLFLTRKPAGLTVRMLRG